MPERAHTRHYMDYTHKWNEYVQEDRHRHTEGADADAYMIMDADADVFPYYYRSEKS